MRTLSERVKLRARERAKEWRKKNRKKHRDYSKKWKEEHSDRVKLADRAWHLKDKYDLTLGDFDRMVTSQEGRCAICRSTDPGAPRWNVDHSHETGEVRGLLCFHCNHVLGHAKDDVAVLANAIAYLNNPPFQRDIA